MYFISQVKHNKNTDTWDKGIVIKNNEADALQTYHAYLGAYGYGHDATIDYVYCRVVESDDAREPIEEKWRE